MIPTDARHLEVLTKLIRPSKIVEIGTLCGYSTVTLARCLQEGGKVYTCERSQHHANVAQETFKELGLEHKIELVFGEALENLNSLSEMGPFDVVFIDADKDNYPNYFHWAVENLRSGGLLIADNVFCLGYIAQDPPPTDRLGELVDAMKKFNSLCAEDPRLTTTFFPTGEGLLAAVKN
jgi:predicted O-methyltransferase YrrM